MGKFLLPGIHHGSGLHSARLRAGTFSSGRDDAKYALVSGNKWRYSDLSATFCSEGAAARSFPYPSESECTIWRVCSLTRIIQLLFPFFVVPAEMQISANNGQGRPAVLYLLSFYVLTPLYLMAHLVLLVQPFVLLRKLRPVRFKRCLGLITFLMCDRLCKSVLSKYTSDRTKCRIFIPSSSV